MQIADEYARNIFFLLKQQCYSSFKTGPIAQYDAAHLECKLDIAAKVKHLDRHTKQRMQYASVQDLHLGSSIQQAQR